jgi:hypothetical protein
MRRVLASSLLQPPRPNRFARPIGASKKSSRRSAQNRSRKIGRKIRKLTLQLQLYAKQCIPKFPTRAGQDLAADTERFSNCIAARLTSLGREITTLVEKELRAHNENILGQHGAPRHLVFAVHHKHERPKFTRQGFA